MLFSPYSRMASDVFETIPHEINVVESQYLCLILSNALITVYKEDMFRVLKYLVLSECVSVSYQVNSAWSQKQSTHGDGPPDKDIIIFSDPKAKCNSEGKTSQKDRPTTL